MLQPFQEVHKYCTDPQNADSAFTPALARTETGALLSWNEPLDGIQRTYQVYWTIDLTTEWSYLATVDNGTLYLHETDEPVAYYKVTAE